MIRGLVADRRGATAVEWAVIGTMLCLITLGFIETAILIPWVGGSMQSIAAAAARCGAIGSSDCSNMPNYIVTKAQKFGLPGTGLTAANVTSYGQVTSCLNTTGRFYQVVISYTAITPVALTVGGGTVTATGCYPIAPT